MIETARRSEQSERDKEVHRRKVQSETDKARNAANTADAAPGTKKDGKKGKGKGTKKDKKGKGKGNKKNDKKGKGKSAQAKPPTAKTQVKAKTKAKPKAKAKAKVKAKGAAERPTSALAAGTTAPIHGKKYFCWPIVARLYKKSPYCPFGGCKKCNDGKNCDFSHQKCAIGVFHKLPILKFRCDEMTAKGFDWKAQSKKFNPGGFQHTPAAPGVVIEEVEEEEDAALAAAARTTSAQPRLQSGVAADKAKGQLKRRFGNRLDVGFCPKFMAGTCPHDPPRENGRHISYDHYTSKLKGDLKNTTNNFMNLGILPDDP